MATVTVQTESPARSGWVFHVLVNGDVVAHEHDVALSWVDYDHWSHGAIAPERIVQAVVEVLLDECPDRELPDRFDASTARRWCPQMDDLLRTRA